MDLDEFSAMKTYLGYSDATAEGLRAFAERAGNVLDETTEDFYQAVQRDPGARAILTGGPAQISRLKESLRDWMQSLLEGPHDAGYLRHHERIGRTHVRIGLPQRYMLIAMNRVRSQLARGVAQVFPESPDEVMRIAAAVHQVLDLELAIMLDSYREDLMEKLKARERLATIGELSATIGHELRNPLGTIESSAYLVGERLAQLEIADARIEKHRVKITSQIQRCTDTINRLLDLARHENLRVEPTRLALLVEEALAEAQDARITLHLDIPQSLSVTADRTQLSMVLLNLLRNAREASPESVSITIAAREVPDGVEIHFGDDGPGVPEEDRRRVFDALFTTRSQGTGLGLALCRRVIEAHRGEITLEASDKGAVFRIWLPSPTQCQ